MKDIFNKKSRIGFQLFFAATIMSGSSEAQERLYDHIFFNNSRMEKDYFFSDMRESANDKGSSRKIAVSSTVFHTPGNSLELKYTNKKDGSWQATVYRQRLRGQDHFKPVTSLSFWVHNPASITNEDLPIVQLVKRDSSLSNKMPFTITGAGDWKQVIIPLKSFGGINASNATELIGVRFSQSKNDDGSHTLYIDDIELLADQKAKPISETPLLNKVTGFAKHVDLEWQSPKSTSARYVKIFRADNGGAFKPVALQDASIGRYADFTGETNKEYRYKITLLDDNYKESNASAELTAKTADMSDDELMTMVQQACFRYYWDGAEKKSGLAKESIPGRGSMIASGASGFGIMALLVGTERKFITRQESVDRFIKIVNFLEKADVFHGAYPHFIDGATGKVEPFFGQRDNGGDLVETAFLFQGLLAARAYFNGSDNKEQTIRQKITSIWKRVEWNWYRRSPDSKFLFWHWSPDQGWIINHPLIGWNETMVTYLLSIASPTFPIPASMYYTGWANKDSTGQKYRMGWSETTEGSRYTNGNSYFGVKLDVGVSNGGPLFFTHYSYLGYDPHQLTDRYTNYFTNNQNIARINYRYCVENPRKYAGYGENCWGLTASDGPYFYSADEPVARQDRGKIAPTGAISSFPYTPAESMNALKNYYHNYGKFLWGEYGFRDAFNLTTNWCSEIYMGLNQAPMVVMIENYRSGLIWKLFMSDADIQNGLKRLEVEK